MKVLVTGGSGLVGAETVKSLVEMGHVVRLLTRNAERDAKRSRVEPWSGSVQNPTDVYGSADGCDCILHIAGIVKEDGMSSTFRTVNVGGTQNLLDEAERSGVQRFVYVSSLGADTGTSDYHASKREAEALVRTFRRDWLICRPGGVYGPGDDTLSVMLQMLQLSPAVPVLNFGTDTFQPIWHLDLASALAKCVEREDLRNQVLLMAGPEKTHMQDIVERLSHKLDKPAVGVPVLEPIVEMGARSLAMLGIETPVAPDQMRMVVDGNAIPDGAENAVTSILGIPAVGLDEGLELLIRAQKVQHREDGVGGEVAQRFAVKIGGSNVDARELFERFATSPGEAFAGTQVNTGASGDGTLEEGATLNLELPAKRIIGVRVTERTDTSATCETLEGHPLAGTVHFAAKDAPDGLVFEVLTLDRPASVPDAALMGTIGRSLQESTWRQVLENVARMSGGKQAGDISVNKG